MTCCPYTENERWYLARTAVWAAALRAGQAAGVTHEPRSDVDFAEAVLGLRAGMRILDLGCGWGRTSLELARRGYAVAGFDLSPALIRLAKERAAQAGAPVGYTQGTVRRLPDLGLFDAVCAFYDDSLISFEEEHDNLAALGRVAASLRRRGKLLFGTSDCPLLLPPSQRSRFKIGDTEIEETISFDRERLQAACHTTYCVPRAAPVTHVRRRRHLRIEEVAALLAAAGLRQIGAWCGYDTDLPFGIRPEGMVIAAELAVGGTV